MVNGGDWWCDGYWFEDIDLPSSNTTFNIKINKKEEEKIEANNIVLVALYSK